MGFVKVEVNTTVLDPEKLIEIRNRTIQDQTDKFDSFIAREKHKVCSPPKRGGMHGHKSRNVNKETEKEIVTTIASQMHQHSHRTHDHTSLLSWPLQMVTDFLCPGKTERRSSCRNLNKTQEALCKKSR